MPTNHLERLLRLDAVWHDIRAAVAADQPDPRQRHAWREVSAHEFTDVVRHVEWRGDVVYAGAGLGLLHALEMARLGWRVLVCDRGEVGCAHREWNISRYELQALVAGGSWSWDELQSVMMNEYSDGIVRFFAPNDDAVTLHLPEVLNVAIDAGALLRLARTKFLQAGGQIRDYRVFGEVVVPQDDTAGVVMRVIAPDQTPEYYQARLVIDGMGTVSPLSLQRFGGRPYAGVCPTVGTVASGFVEGTAANEHNRSLGDILLTIADAQKTRTIHVGRIPRA
jgi:lycopene cyclase CruA